MTLNVTYQVVLTDDALVALEEAIAFIAETSPQNAKMVRLAILQKIDTLDKLPNRFSQFKPWRNQQLIYRSIVVKEHVIVYRVYEDKALVAVVDVHYGRRNK